MSNARETHHPGHAFRSRISAGIDRFIPAHVSDGDPDALRRARLVVVYGLTLIAAAIIYAVILLAMNSAISAISLALAIGVTLVALQVMRWTGSSFAAGNLLTAAFFGVLTAIACRLGGHGALELPWYAAVPVVALSTAGRRSAILWLAVTASSLTAFYVLDYSGYYFPNDLAPHHYELLCLLAWIGLIVLMLGLALMYEMAKERMVNRLAQQRDFLNTVVESLANPFLVIDANDYSICLANAAARRNGAPGAKTCHAATHRRDTPCEGSNDPCPLVEVRRTGKPTMVEHTHYGADGSPQLFEVYAYPVFDENGRVVQVIESSLDITERKQAEGRLRESEERYRAITETASDAIIAADVEGNIRLWNAGAEKIFGFTAAEAVGRSLMDLIVPAQYHEAKQKGLAKFAHTGRGAAVGKMLELTALRKDGTEFPVEISISSYQDKNDFVGVALVRDITERRQAETARELAIERRQRLNELQRALLGPGGLDAKLTQITDGVVDILDVDFCRIWLTQPGDLCESGCMHADVTEGPHVCRHRDRCLRLRASSGRYKHIDGEVHRRVPFGCYKIGRVASSQDSKFLTNEVTTDPQVHNHDWAKKLGLVSFVGYQLQPRGGETIGVLALFSKHPIDSEMDALLEGLGSTAALMVQKAQADEDLEAATKKLVESSRKAGMSEVATDVLHNVGNVLNSVNVSAGLVNEKIRGSRVQGLSRATALMSEHADDLGAFITQDERGKHLPGYLTKLAEYLADEQTGILGELRYLTENVEHIKNIVSMQQSLSGVSGVSEPVRLDDLLDDLLKMDASSLEHRGIMVVREYDELPVVTIDKYKLTQILVNLLKNARDALTEDQRRDRRLTVRLKASDEDCVQIEVADNAVGIPPENLTQIFAHGFTTKKDGHGFGLHGSALAAKELGGSLTAYSDGPGQGATFALELPLRVTEKSNVHVAV